MSILLFLLRWCGPCKILGPRLEKMVAKQDGKVVMAKVDIDDHTDLAIEYEVGTRKARACCCCWHGACSSAEGMSAQQGLGGEGKPSSACWFLVRWVILQ